MCLAAIRFLPRAHNYKLILIFNRDETYPRPNKGLHWWNNQLIGGMDMEPGREGGSWLVMTKQGKLSALTNVLQKQIQLNKSGRGRLVVDYCESDDSAAAYFNKLNLSTYNPFNLLLLDIAKSECFFFNSGDEALTDLNDGKCHVMSNAPVVNSEWLKAQSLRSQFQTIIEKENVPKADMIHELLLLLQNDTFCGHDPAVLKQGKPLISRIGMETYSSIMIRGENATQCEYGTRTHSIIIVDKDNNCTFVEVDRNSDATWTSTTEEFTLQNDA